MAGPSPRLRGSITAAGLRMSPDLIELALSIRGQLGQERYDAMARVFRDVAAQHARDLVATPPEVFQLMQGRAQTYAALDEIFSNLDQYAAQLRAALESQHRS